MLFQMDEVSLSLSSVPLGRDYVFCAPQKRFSSHLMSLCPWSSSVVNHLYVVLVPGVFLLLLQLFLFLEFIG